MPSTLPYTREENDDVETPCSGTFSVRTTSSPAATFSVPRVTMKSLMPNLVISRPLTSPKRTPVASPTRTASTVGAPSFSAHSEVPALSPATVPMDRSMPPEVMTTATPTVMSRIGMALVM